jgi:hypothetical protein
VSASIRTISDRTQQAQPLQPLGAEGSIIVGSGHGRPTEMHFSSLILIWSFFCGEFGAFCAEFGRLMRSLLEVAC